MMEETDGRRLFSVWSDYSPPRGIVLGRPGQPQDPLYTMEVEACRKRDRDPCTLKRTMSSCSIIVFSMTAMISTWMGISYAIYYACRALGEGDTRCSWWWSSWPVFAILGTVLVMFSCMIYRIDRETARTNARLLLEEEAEDGVI